MSSMIEARPGALTEFEPPAPYAEQAEDRPQVNLLAIAWQNRWTIVVCMVLGGLAAWGALKRTTPRYTSESRVFVERSLPRLLESQLQFGQSASYLYTQAQLIGSTPVLAAAVEKPENADLTCFREVENRVGFLKEVIQVEVGREDDIINIRAELPVADEAALLVNSVVEAYVDKYELERKTDAGEVLEILRGEKERRDAELEDRRQALADFRAEHAALAVQVENENVVSRRFSTLAETLGKTEIELLEAKALHNRVQKMHDTPSQRLLLIDLAMRHQQPATEMGLDNQMLLGLQRQIQEVELQVAAEGSKWGTGHPRVRLLKESLAQLEERKTEKKEEINQHKQLLAKAYVDSVRQEFELLEHKRDELQKSYDEKFQEATEVSSQTLELATLDDALERTEKLCDILDDRIKEVNLSEEVGAMNVSIMEVAGPSMKPSYPQPAKFLALGTLLGGLTGFGLAWLRNLLDHRLRSIDEIANTLQLPVLGILPLQGETQDRHHIGRVVFDHPRSTAAEAIRTLRTAMHFGVAGEEEVKTISVTSPSAGDGKSIVASNLAIAMSQADQRVLLIGADLRKPTQHQIFGCPNERGLSAVLSERLPVIEAIQTGVAGTLDLLNAGQHPPNPAELLNHEYFSEILTELRAKYDKIIIDSPPIMPVADGRVIAAQVDSVILVLRAERSTRRMSLAARNELWQVRAQRIGVVVNGVPSRRHGTYGYGYGGVYGGGYGDYGFTSYGYGEDESPRRGKKRKALTAAGSVAT